MEKFDLAIAYTWEYDQELVEAIEKIFQLEGLKTFVIGEFNLDEVLTKISANEIIFKALLDRASDENDKFLALPKLCSSKGVYIINPLKRTITATNKATMHRKLRTAKIRVPYTYIIPSSEKSRGLKIKQPIFNKLGIPFIVKPATYSGGGQAVMEDAKTIEDIEKTRNLIPQDKFLLQKKITPPNIGKRRLWFRCYWFFGLIIPVWWNDKTHIYNNISKIDYKKYHVYKLVTLTKKLAKITSLDYFSTEATLDENRNFVLIDYVNDQCDFRFKSKHADGVPDRVVKFFIKAMLKKIKRLK